MHVPIGLRRVVAVVCATALATSPALLAPTTAGASGAPTTERAAMPHLTAKVTKRGINVKGTDGLRAGRAHLTVNGPATVEFVVFKAGYGPDQFVADAAAKVIEHLQTDPDAYAQADVVFDQLIEINLDELAPMINGPHSPDLAHSVEKLGDDAREAGWPLEISSALIGSCTNSSYEDITRTASIARQAAAAGLRVKTSLLVTPGSERVRATIERDGLLADLEAIGATVLANAVRIFRVA